MHKRKPFGIRVSGPLEPFVSGFLEELARQGYSPWSATSYLVVMRHLSLWLGDHDWSASGLTGERVQEFVADRRALGYAKGRSTGGMVEVLTRYLRKVGVTPEAVSPVPETHLERVLEGFVTYLSSERGLAQRTIHWYRYVGHRFLSTFGIGDGIPGQGFEDLTADKINEYVLMESKHRSTGSLQNVTVALRALLGFLYLEGHTPVPLAAAVLPTPSWRDDGISRALSEQEVTALLATCDRQTNTGRRNYAILMLLARLGLRAQEVASLRLDDVDWRTGKILVAGKQNRHDQLPLPMDVGEALADYCHQARPRGGCRTLFLHVRAPYGSLTNSSIGTIVAEACKRAGLPRVGAHRLRHTTATAMRRAGAPLLEIGRVLRHSRPVTTAHYAKDDCDALVGVVRRWPGGAA